MWTRQWTDSFTKNSMNNLEPMTKDELIALMNNDELKAVKETQDIEKVDVISVLLEYMNQ